MTLVRLALGNATSGATGAVDEYALTTSARRRLVCCQARGLVAGGKDHCVLVSWGVWTQVDRGRIAARRFVGLEPTAGCLAQR